MAVNLFNLVWHTAICDRINYQGKETTTDIVASKKGKRTDLPKIRFLEISISHQKNITFFLEFAQFLDYS